MTPQIELMGGWSISIGMFMISAAIILGSLIRSGLNRIAEAIKRTKESTNAR